MQRSVIAERVIEKHPTQNQMFDSRQTASQSLSDGRNSPVQNGIAPWVTQ